MLLTVGRRRRSSSFRFNRSTLDFLYMTRERGQFILPEHMREVRAETKACFPLLPAGRVGHGVFAFVVQTFAPLISGTLSKLLGIFLFMLDSYQVWMVVHLGESEIAWDSRRNLAHSFCDIVQLLIPEGVRDPQSQACRNWLGKELNILRGSQ